MIPFLPLFVFVICLVAIWFITSQYEYKFEYPFKERLVDLISKSHAFHVPEEPIQAEHREVHFIIK